MSSVFTNSMRSLNADSFRGSLAVLVLAATLFCGWSAWFFFARVALYEVSASARIEIEGAVGIEAPIDGRVVSVQAALNQTVRAGDVILQIETDTQRQRIRAPMDGILAELTVNTVGVSVRSGDRLGTIVPNGKPTIIAFFASSDALGRIQPGQRAVMRLDGFPSSQYGSLQAEVVRVAGEINGSLVRVELVPVGDTTLPLRYGLPGSVEVEVDSISPAYMVLRAAGQLSSPSRLPTPIPQ